MHAQYLKQSPEQATFPNIIYNNNKKKNMKKSENINFRMISVLEERKKNQFSK